LKGIIKKNFILLWRSKRAVLAILIGPLLLITLLGLAFNNTGLNKISIAAYSTAYNDMSNSLLDKLEENNLNIAKIDNEMECVDSIKLGRHHLCIIFPANFNIGQENSLVVYLDKSKVNLVGNIVSLLSSPIDDESAELSLDLTGVLLEKLTDANTVNLNNDELVFGIQSANTNSREKINKMIIDIGELNITVSQGISKMYELGSTIRQGRNSEGLLKEILETVEDSRDIIDDLEPTAELNELDGHLEEIKNDINSASTLDITYWDSFESLVQNLSSNMEDVKNRIGLMLGELNSVKNYIDSGDTDLKSLQLNLNAVNASLNTIKVRDATTIVNPIVTDIRPIAPEKSHLHYIFPTLLTLIIMFSAVLLSSMSEIVEKKDGAYFRNFISPAGNFIFLIASFVTDFAIIAFQLIIFLGMSLLFLDIGTFSNPGLLIILFAVVSFFILLGILIGRIFNSEEGGVLFSIVITSAMLFFSGTILPIENMSGIVYKISGFNPFVLSETLFRKSIIHGLGISLIWEGLLLILAWTALVVLFILIADKLKKMKLVFVKR